MELDNTLEDSIRSTAWIRSLFDNLHTQVWIRAEQMRKRFEDELGD